MNTEQQQELNKINELNNYIKTQIYKIIEELKQDLYKAQDTYNKTIILNKITTLDKLIKRINQNNNDISKLLKNKIPQTATLKQNIFIYGIEIAKNWIEEIQNAIKNNINDFKTRQEIEKINKKYKIY